MDQSLIPMRHAIITQILAKKPRPMDEHLIPRLLDRTTVDRAYPLVRNIVPGITLDRWNQFVKPHLATRSPKWPRGLMTIQNALGYILGLFGFEVRDDLHDNRTLFVDNIIVPDIPGRDLIWAAAVNTAETLAVMNSCRAIRMGLTNEFDSASGDHAWRTLSLAKAGYTIEGVRASKRVDNLPPERSAVGQDDAPSSRPVTLN